MMRRVLTLGSGMALCTGAFALVAQAAIGITGYHNIHIATPDPEGAVAWYVEYLGARRTTPDQTHVMIGDTLIAFQPADAIAPSAGSVIDHYGISVDDIDAVLDGIEAAGATNVSAPRDVPGLFRLAFLEDPWGAKIELVEDAEWPGFHHVHLRVPDPGATLDWYEGIFGGTREPLKGRIDGLRYGGVWLLAADSEGERLAPSAERAIRNIAWGIADINEAVAAFRAVGAKTLIEPFTVAEVVHVAFFEDPNGVSVEVLQLPQ